MKIGTCFLTNMFADMFADQATIWRYCRETSNFITNAVYYSGFYLKPVSSLNQQNSGNDRFQTTALQIIGHKFAFYAKGKQDYTK